MKIPLPRTQAAIIIRPCLRAPALRARNPLEEQVAIEKTTARVAIIGEAAACCEVAHPAAQKHLLLISAVARGFYNASHSGVLLDIT
ncbi:MAG: hypothetical protein L0Z68_02185 [Gammaproteobacteria bacterium]|nr:hypothetical protein [Gammaproteobacteria bacterium]